MANPDIEKRIQNFPLRTMKVRGVSFLVRVDPETNLGYIMAENGTSWTGKKAKVGKPPESQTVSDGSSTPSDLKGESEPPKKKWWKMRPKEKRAPQKEKKKSDSDRHDSNCDKQEAKRKKALIIIAITAVVLVVVPILGTSGIFSSSNSNGSTQNTDESLETENIAALAAAENYEVLILIKLAFRVCNHKRFSPLCRLVAERLCVTVGFSGLRSTEDKDMAVNSKILRVITHVNDGFPRPIKLAEDGSVAVFDFLDKSNVLHFLFRHHVCGTINAGF